MFIETEYGFLIHTFLVIVVPYIRIQMFYA